MGFDTSAMLNESELTLRRRAVRFFRLVLIASSGASIVGNALHAVVHASSVSPVLAAAVATAPPLVLLGSTEGSSLLIKVRRRPTLTYWAALTMTLLLALAAFRLSFDALRDLAVLCGLRPSLAWLWPLVIDVTITQATVSLLALSRQDPRADTPSHTNAEDTAEPSGDGKDAVHEDARAQASVVTMVGARRESAAGRTSAAGGSDHHNERAVHAVMASKRTKQPPEVVRAVLERHANGAKTNDICDQLNLHHSTVSRIIATAMHRPTAVG